MYYVSILITIYNTKLEYFKDCLNSIQNQTTKFNIQLVIVDDGSNDENAKEYLKLLNTLENENNNIKVKYNKLEENMGVGYASNIGVELCDNELIYRMDSDDIMSPTRLKQQYDFMNSNPDYNMCCGDIRFFEIVNGKINYLEKTNHPEFLTYENFLNEFNNSGNYWFVNHPTFCMRKNAILEIGNYNKNYRSGIDIDLTVRFLKKYGKIYNIKVLPVMILYRWHDSNISKQCSEEKYNIYQKRVLELIET